MSLSSSIRSAENAYIKQYQKNLYEITLSLTTDICRIAAMSNLSYEKTLESLEDIISLANPRSKFFSGSKEWSAFKEAYINYEEKRIVLSNPPNEATAINLNHARIAPTYEDALKQSAKITINPDLQKRIYQIALSDTTDIHKIADITNMSYEETMNLLYLTISQSSTRFNGWDKKWYAFKGAHINYEKKRIVLAISPEELVTNGTGRGGSWALRICGYFLGLFVLSLSFLLDSEWYSYPPSLGIALIFIGLSIFMVVLSHVFGRSAKRLRKYIRLICDEKINSITEIAHVIKKPVEFVEKDLQKLIDCFCLVNARIDFETNKILVVSSKK